MQNRYVGDVGDFGKHGLLRFLSGMTDPEGLEPRLRVGLIWYMHHDEMHGVDKKKINGDGRHISYLDLTRQNMKLYGNCDPELWSKLGHLVGQDRRCVHCAEEARLLPEDTKFYDAPLTYIPRMLPEQKAAIRECWVKNALLETREADLVCVDPDNGIAPKSKMYDPAKGAKFVYMPDLKAIWERKQSLVVYQHIDHSEPASAQVERVVATLRDGLENAEPIPLVFHRGSARVFYVIPRPDHKEIIDERVRRFLERGWEANGHFERVGYKGVSHA